MNIDCSCCNIFTYHIFSVVKFANAFICNTKKRYWTLSRRNCDFKFLPRIRERILTRFNDVCRLLGSSYEVLPNPCSRLCFSLSKTSHFSLREMRSKIFRKKNLLPISPIVNQKTSFSLHQRTNMQKLWYKNVYANSFFLTLRSTMVFN